MTNIILADISNISNNWFEQIYDLVDLDRREKTDKYIFDRDKHLSLMSEICLYYLLAEKFHIKYSFIEKDYTMNGKPVISNISNLYYSISHSGNKCIVGLSDISEIGIDMEYICGFSNSQFKDTLMKIFSEDEMKKIQSNENDIVKALILWTNKEAYFKSQGVGTFRSMLHKSFSNSELKSISTVIKEGYIISYANFQEPLSFFDVREIGVDSMIDCIKKWKA